jgi:hypothetical protein
MFFYYLQLEKTTQKEFGYFFRKNKHEHVLLCHLVINQLSISAYIKIKPIVIVNFNARHVVKGYN